MPVDNPGGARLGGGWLPESPGGVAGGRIRCLWTTAGGHVWWLLGSRNARAERRPDGVRTDRGRPGAVRAPGCGRRGESGGRTTVANEDHPVELAARDRAGRRRG